MTERHKDIKTKEQKNGIIQNYRSAGSRLSVFLSLRSFVFRFFCAFVLCSLFSVLCSLSSSAEASLFGKSSQVLVRVFFLPSCKACHKAIEDIIPPIERKYGDKAIWEYVDITNKLNYQRFLSLEKISGRKLGTPTVLVGNNVLVGVFEIADSLDKFIGGELLKKESQAISLDEGNIDLLERFKSFGPLTVIGAGLVDGINPCAFTVIVFFISFLSLMGYKRREMVLIGVSYILAVYFTYLALGFGLFKALYTIKGFYSVSKIIYMIIGSLSIFLGILAIKDYIHYKLTGKTDDMALQLPKVIKNKIHAIVGEHYRLGKVGQKKALAGLVFSALAVGFLVSLLESVCTGQMYLPTIVFVFKEGALRSRALLYLIVYNLMFILPLVLVLMAALAGVNSKQFEAYARKNMGVIKIGMASVFLVLGLALLLGI